MRGKKSGTAAPRPDAQESRTLQFNREHYGRVIRERRQALGMTQSELAAAVRGPKNNVTHWEAGRTRPDLNTVPLVCEALQIDLGTFFGVQEHYEPLSRADRDLLRSFHALGAHDRRVILSTIGAMQELSRQELLASCRECFLLIPRSDQSASAGSGEALQEGSQQPVFIRKSPAAQRADEIVRVNGDSMEPVFHHGQEVYVQHTDSLRPGEIGLFTVNGEGFIKQLDRGRLHSLNPAFADVALHESDDVRCVGRVLGPVEQDARPTAEELAILEDLAAGGRMGAD